jgi:hypothetical protein
MPAATLKLEPAEHRSLCCSMCGRDASKLRYLMVGAAGAYICDACTVAAMKIVVAQRVRDAVPFRRRPTPTRG